MVSVEQATGSPRGPRSRGTRFAWLFPDLAVVAATVTLFYCLFLFQGYRRLFRDSDAGWHIRTGETILATHRLPRTDPYSFSRAGAPWFAWEWLSDLAAGATHQAAGLTGVALLYAGAIAAGVWLWFKLHWAVGGNFLLAAAMAPLMLTTASLHWMARPHIFGWLFLLAAVLYLERARPPFRAWHLAVTGLFAALWANVHASFFLAPLLALLYAAGCLTRPSIWQGESDSVREKGRWFVWVAAVAAVAPLANPYGWGLYGHVFRYLTDSALLARIGEFQSFDFHSAGSGQIAAGLLIGFGGGVLALARRRTEHFALAILFGALALRSARALPLAALVLLPLANGAIAECCTRASGLNARFRAALDGFLAYGARLRALDSRFSGAVLAPAILALCFFLLRTPAILANTGFPPDQFPVAAYQHIPAGARLFAPDKFGGYLIYRSAGSRKVFFDGRSDFYGAEFLQQYGRLVQARPGWRAWWDTFHFTHALLPPDAPLLAALEQSGWRRIYADTTAVLLVAGLTDLGETTAPLRPRLGIGSADFARVTEPLPRGSGFRSVTHPARNSKLCVVLQKSIGNFTAKPGGNRCVHSLKVEV